MCGIIAVHDPQRRPIDAELVRRQCRVMEHRGPDDEGYHFAPGVALGMRRLSIIDIEGGRQPIYNEDRSVALVFNGEIYNQRELRAELEARGHRFGTHADTEVIVHLYEEHGSELVHRLNGMFAFALWDARRQSLLAARDRLGIKPLYLTERNGRLLFASEIKALLEDPAVPRRVNLEALHHYLHYLYVPAPRSLFAGIEKLPPGHLMECSAQGVETRRWWNVEYSPDPGLTTAQWAAQLEERLERSVAMRLMADVPLGAYLSGGIDSSVIVALMSHLMDQPVKTFTLGFGEGNEAFNELAYAREVAELFGTDHHEYTVREEEVAELLDDIVWHSDEPFGGGLHTYFISKLAKPHVTVALTGLGSDELFAGYDRHVRLRLAHLYRRLPGALRGQLEREVFPALPPRLRGTRTAQRIERLAARSRRGDADNYAAEINLLAPRVREEVYSDALARDLERTDLTRYLEDSLAACASPSRWDRLSYLELRTTMVDDFLDYVDHMGMAHSLELRVPFLDHELVELAARIPFRHKVRGLRTTKHVLKVLARRLLPARIVHRRKQPFFLPLGSWLRGGLTARLREVLDTEKLREQGYFDAAGVARILAEHEAGFADHGWPIWALLVFQSWHDRFIEPTHATTHSALLP